MLNITEILQKVKSEQPDRIVDQIYDFDEKWVLVKAPTRLGQQEFNALFLVSKQETAVIPFLPFDEPDKYLVAIRNFPIYQAR